MEIITALSEVQVAVEELNRNTTSHTLLLNRILAKLENADNFDQSDELPYEFPIQNQEDLNSLEGKLRDTTEKKKLVRCNSNNWFMFIMPAIFFKKSKQVIVKHVCFLCNYFVPFIDVPTKMRQSCSHIFCVGGLRFITT